MSLGLISILLSFLFMTYSRMAQFNIKLELARGVLLQRQHFSTRLQNIFISMDDATFYTHRFPKDKRDSLVTIFDNGIDPDPAFSGSVMARIYLDDENNLAVALWPLKKTGKQLPWRKEILLSDVERCQFFMFGLDPASCQKLNTAQFMWHDDWSKSWKRGPIMIRCLVQQQGSSFAYAFFSPSSKDLISCYSQATSSMKNFERGIP